MRYLLILLLLFLVPNAFANEGRSVVYEVGGDSYEGYFVDSGAEAPLILLIHDWDGLTDYEVKRTGMLARLGYSVFAVDLFGKAVRPGSLEDRKKTTGALYADRARMRRLIEAGVNAAKAQGGNLSNAILMGYCFGGTAVLEYARGGADLKGFVSFHGGLAIPEDQDYAATKGEVLVFHGSADTAVSLDEFASLAKALETAGVSHEMITYGGAPHAFTVFGGDRYREDADRRSWARFTAFLEETLK